MQFVQIDVQVECIFKFLSCLNASQKIQPLPAILISKIIWNDIQVHSLNFIAD